MPNSLRARVNKLYHKGLISEEDCNRIREALAKQIAKKPKYVPFDADCYSCPICGRYVGDNEWLVRLNYCTDCGQKIDWREIYEH